MTTVKQKLAYLAVTAIPIFLWAKLIHRYLQYKKLFIAKTNAHNKHNCVVTYSKEGGMYGWPDYPERLPLNLDSYSKFLEPVIYFVSTAERRLDISVMILNSDGIIKALIEAADRGVKIRLILDGKFDDTKQLLRKLLKKGAKILYDSKFLNPDTIMHHKYAIKDFNSSNGSGYSLCGSLNWTQSAFNENYEFLVLSTNVQVVGGLYKNFEETWEFLQKVKETHLLNEHLFQL